MDEEKWDEDEQILLDVEEKTDSVLFPVDRYRGEDIKYSWSCLWAEIK